MPKHEDIVAASHSETSHVEDNAKGGEDFIEDSTPGLFLNLCVLATAIGGMLFGYDTGVISGVLVVLGDDLDGRLMSHGEKELITSLCAAGALFGAIIAGVTADKYGRKPAIWFASVLFTMGAVVQASSYSLIQMCVGRVLVGLGVGSASMVRFFLYTSVITDN
jgi:SP family myo-inositol transporter-like MFS transporter 13